jgi:hypothetical protein
MTHVSVIVARSANVPDRGKAGDVRKWTKAGTVKHGATHRVVPCVLLELAFLAHFQDQFQAFLKDPTHQEWNVILERWTRNFCLRHGDAMLQKMYSAHRAGDRR